MTKSMPVPRVGELSTSPWLGPVPQFLDARAPVAFWERCMPEPMSGCWLWIGCVMKDGYGKFKMGRARQFSAHRFLFTALVGKIDSGLELDHLCRVRSCVNPTHLEPVPHRINGLRGVSPAAVNATKEVCGICGGEYKTESNNGRRCERCHKRTATALRRKRYQSGLCHQGASHGPATRGRRCESCAEKHRIDQEKRNRARSQEARRGRNS